MARRKAKARKPKRKKQSAIERRMAAVEAELAYLTRRITGLEKDFASVPASNTAQPHVDPPQPDNNGRGVLTDPE